MRKSLFPDENQNTLLEPLDFAKVLMKAIRKEYKSGTHIVVRKQNVQELLKSIGDYYYGLCRVFSGF